jgi:hypothetical protein
MVDADRPPLRSSAGSESPFVPQIHTLPVASISEHACWHEFMPYLFRRTQVSA